MNDTTNKNTTFVSNLKKYQAGLPVGQKNSVVSKNGTKIPNIKQVPSDSNQVTQVAKQSTAANKQTSSVGQGQSTCSNFCRQIGFHILPLRYTVVTGNAPVLPSTLGKHVKDITLAHYKYAVEMVDSGYIYRLVRRTSGTLEWAGYKVTPKGHLSYFPVGKEAPKNVPEFACKGEGHHFASSVITVESKPNDPAKFAYILYTEVPLSKRKLNDYEKNAEQFVSQGKWQKILVGTGSSQEHCISANQIKSTIYNIKSFGEARISFALNRFSQQPKSFACMALYDPVGITKKLNDFRNTAFKNLMHFLSQSEANISNEQRLHSSQYVDSIKLCIENKILSGKKQLSSDTVYNAVLRTYMSELPKNLSDSDDIKYELEKIYNKKSFAEKKQRTEEITKRLNAEKGIHNQSMATMSRNEAQAIWKTKYAPKINWTAKNAFDQKVEQLIQQGKQQAERLADDHIKWLTSQAVIRALYAYDEYTQDPYGNLFHVVVMGMINGMSGMPAGQAVMEKWLGVEKITDDNLYMRAITYNQKSLIDAYNAKSSAITNLNWDDAQSNLKSLIGAFVSADQYWEKWLSDPSNKINELKWYNPAKALPWISEATQSVAKWSLKYNADPAIAKKLGRVSFVVYAHSSVLTDKVPKWSLLYNLDIKQVKAGSKPNATQIQKNWKKANENITTKKIEEILKKSPERIKLRISAIVALFELINLGSQSNKFKNERSLENGFQFTAGMLASASAVLDVSSGGMEMLSFQEKANRIRLYGAWFAVLGSVFSAILDGSNLWKEYFEERSIGLLIILGFKALTSFGIVATGAGMLILLPSLSNVAFVNRLRAMIIVDKLIRFGLIRAVTWLNWIGLTLSLLELILRTYYFDDDLQVWCKKSVFGIDNNKYLSIKEEEEAFNKAIMST